MNDAKLKVYSYLMLQKIIQDFWRIYGEGDIWDRRPMTRNILLKLILRLDQTTLEGAYLHAIFCLAFVGSFQMGKLTYNKVESNFNSWNLTQGLIFFFKDWLFLVILSCKTNLFRQRIILSFSTASNKICAIASFNNSFTQFPKANHQPLFSNHTGKLNHNYITKKLQNEICTWGYKRNYTSHSFKRKAAMSARMAGLLEDKIQLLGK